MSTTARSVVASSRSGVARLVRERLCGCALLVLDQKLEGSVTARVRQRRLCLRCEGLGRRAQATARSRRQAWLGSLAGRCLARRRVRARSAWSECGGTTGTKQRHAGCMAWMSAGERTWQGQGEVGSMAKPLGLPGSRTCGTDGGTARQQRHGSKIMHGVKLSSLTYRAWKTSTTCPHAC